MTSPMTAIGGIQQLADSLSGLGSALSSAAPSGGFEAVLSQINSEMSDLQNGGTDTSAQSQPSSAETSSLLGRGTNLSAASLTTGGSTSVTGSDVVNDAANYLGVPYVWGGTNPATGLDCSGLVQRVYADLGINLPRTSQEQAQVGTPVASLADAQPGDLLFFPGSDGTAASPGHVGIYIGNGQMIAAPHTGTDVQVESVASVGTPTSIRRILPSATSSIDLTDASYSGAGTTGSDPGMNSLGVPASLQSLFEQAGERYNINPLLLASVAKQESGFQTNVVSGAGAEGLMQLMPGTAAGLGVSPFDPGSAIDGAAQLLSGYLAKYQGSVSSALAAYNAGPGAVAQYGGVPPYAQTQSYVSNITSMLAQATQAEQTSGVVQ